MKTNEASFSKTSVESFAKTSAASFVKTSAARLSKPAWIASACLALSACVTINIYFPAAAAEKAADKIIEEVWQTQKAEPQQADQPVQKEQK